MANASSNKKEPAAIFDISSDDEEVENGNGRPRTIKQILSQKAVRQAGLLPPEFYKNPSISGQSSKQIDETKFKDPISKKTKLRLIQTYQDYTVASAIDTLIHFLLGRNMKATIYPTSREQLKTKEEVDKKLREILKEFELEPNAFEDFQTHIDMVDLNAELYEKHLPEAYAQETVFGRAALWKVRATKDIESEELLYSWGFREGTPVSLRPLDSLSLGQVVVDTKSWEPKIIEYEGNLGSVDDVTRQRKQTEEIKIEDLIYFTRNDFNIVADSYNYGFTRLLDAIPISENKRRLTKKVLAEINNNQWAGLNIFEIAGMSTKDMQAFANTLRAGRNKITNQPIEVHSITPQFDMAGNLEQLKQLHLNLLMAVKVPSFLMNFEQITNRATSEAVLSAWRETVLEAERNHLRTVLWKYWYRPLMETYFPDSKFLYMRIKILQEFQDIEFASLFEKTLGVTQLYNARIIGLREAREILNRPPFPEDEQDQIDISQKLLNENPDMIEPLQEIGEAEREENKQMERTESRTPEGREIKTLISSNSKVRDPATILSRLRKPPKPGGRR